MEVHRIKNLILYKIFFKSLIIGVAQAIIKLC